MEEMMDKFYRYCLQGDIPAAVHYLRKEVPQTDEVIALLHQYEEVFFSEQPRLEVKSEDIWIKETILIYYQYFVDVLTKRKSLAEGEQSLLSALSTFLGHAYESVEAAEVELKQLFEAKGYSFLGGKTMPFYGPYIWHDTEKKEYEVELPLGSQRVTVYLLDDFLLQSWLHFATFGKKSTGGWAKPEGLYCVTNRYKNIEENPAFLITFLKHEAQHYYDLAKYPQLTSWELEYRAKLVEIIYGDSSSLLKRFIQEAVHDENFPHLYAASKIKEEFLESFISMTKLERLSAEDITQYALTLYTQHTEQLDHHQA